MNLDLIAPEVIQRFAGSLLHFVWQGAVIAMITAVGLRLLRHRSAEARYAFAIGSLICMLAAPLFTRGVLFADRRSRPAADPRAKPGGRGRASRAASLQTSLWAQRILLAWFVGVIVFATRLIVGWRLSLAAGQVGGRDSHSGRHEDLRERSGTSWTSRAHSIACACAISILRLLWDGCAPWCCCRFP